MVLLPFLEQHMEQVIGRKKAAIYQLLAKKQNNLLSYYEKGTGEKNMKKNIYSQMTNAKIANAKPTNAKIMNSQIPCYAIKNLSRAMLFAFSISLISAIPTWAGQWRQEGSQWYYEQDGTDLRNCWQEIDGAWYYFKDSGVMAADETIDGYYVGADGAWVENGQPESGQQKRVYEHEGDSVQDIINNYLTLDTKYEISLEQLKEKNRASYTAGTGSVYGWALNQTELDQVAQKVHHIVTNYITNDMTNVQRVDMLYAYLMNTCGYAPTWQENRANTAWGALVYGEAQCSGFARGFKALCDAIDIPCYYVHANEQSANPSHQWNIVQVDGNWYHIDAQAGLFLLSDKAYAWTGMEWNREEFPQCPTSYHAFHELFPYYPEASWIKE